MDLIPYLFVALMGAMFGAAIAAGCFRRMIELERRQMMKESWRAARRFYLDGKAETTPPR